MPLSRFAFPTDIRFGIGARSALPDVLAEQGLRRPLVVTDGGVAALAEFVDLVRRAGDGGAAVAVFDGVHGNPDLAQVSAGVDAYRAHRADGVVGIGGGAAVDVAKAVALMATHDGALFDYEDEVPGARPITDAVAPIVALPTTAGTGSEVGRSAVVSDADHVKRIVFSPHLLPRVVLADPELTVGLPAGLTAATGMDAITHNVEAFLSPAFHPLCDGIALEGLRLAFAALPVAVAHPTDLDARGSMLMASMMGAIAFQKGLGIVHSCAHALGTVADLHHGLANGVMIDHALVGNVGAVPEKFVQMARTVGLADERPEAFLAALVALKAEVGVPATLGPLGVGVDRLDALVAVALADGCHANNPVPVTASDFRAVFIGALA